MSQSLAPPNVRGPSAVARAFCQAFLVAVAVGVLAPIVEAALPCTATDALEGALLSNPSASTHNDKGEYFADRGNSECAAQSFRNALRLDSEAWLPRFNLGLVHLGGRELGQALDHLEIAAAGRPDHLEVRLALGSAMLGLGRLQQAAQEFTRGTEINPSSAVARQRLAQTLLEQGRHSAAISQIALALEIEPASPGALLLLGSAHSKSGHPELAVEPLERLVTNEPDHFAGHFNLAAAYAQQDRFAEASEHYSVAMSLDPLHPIARLSAAKVEVNLRNFQEALELTQPWADGTPPSVDAFEVDYLRGICLRALGSTADAEAALRRAVNADDANPEARQALGELLAQRQDFSGAREQLRSAKELDPDSQQIRYALISVLRELDDADSLRAELESFELRKRQIQSEGLAARAAERAVAYLNNGDAATALREYDQALKHHPRDPMLYYGRALALSAMGRHTDRIDSLEAALELAPNSAAAHNELGLALQSLGRASEAEAAFMAAIRSDPQYAAARGNLGVLYMTLGRHAEAVGLFQRAAEDDPGTSHMRVNHGLALAALGRLNDAENAVRAALKINPENLKARSALEFITSLRTTEPRADGGAER